MIMMHDAIGFSFFWRWTFCTIVELCCHHCHVLRVCWLVVYNIRLWNLCMCRLCKDCSVDTKDSSVYLPKSQVVLMVRIRIVSNQALRAITKFLHNIVLACGSRLFFAQCLIFIIMITCGCCRPFCCSRRNGNLPHQLIWATWWRRDWLVVHLHLLNIEGSSYLVILELEPILLHNMWCTT